MGFIWEPGDPGHGLRSEGGAAPTRTPWLGSWSPDCHLRTPLTLGSSLFRVCGPGQLHLALRRWAHGQSLLLSHAHPRTRRAPRAGLGPPAPGVRPGEQPHQCGFAAACASRPLAPASDAHARPSSPPPAGRITLSDLKRCKLAGVFFDTFFNIEKYLDHEQREQASLLRVSVAGAPGRRRPPRPV